MQEASSAPLALSGTSSCILIHMVDSDSNDTCTSVSTVSKELEGSKVKHNDIINRSTMNK